MATYVSSSPYPPLRLPAEACVQRTVLRRADEVDGDVDPRLRVGAGRVGLVEGVREDDETDADAGVGLRLHVGEDGLEGTGCGGPLVVLLHAAGAIEDEDHVDGRLRRLGRRRGAAGVPEGASFAGAEAAVAKGR